MIRALASIYTRAEAGIHAPLVRVEVHLANGLPALSIVGLPEAAVKESKDRVRAALLNCGFEFPARRITINLAPADLPKEGGRYDLPIALGILAASAQIPQGSLEGWEAMGELALSGELRPVRGLLPAALSCRNANHQMIAPLANAEEAALVENSPVRCANHLLEICAILRGEQAWQPLPDVMSLSEVRAGDYPDLADVRGQHQARRALEIAAAGNHNILFVGPPGTGKTMLASRLPGILPPLTEQEALEVATLSSISRNGFSLDSWGKRPYRAPHHTSSGVALVGGGSNPRPGEISLAHRGVLFLDELPEFSRQVLDVLREPLESGHITISRAARQADFPANFLLITAMNPCPCGYFGDPDHPCRCTPEAVKRYRGRISGPFLDRIDLQVEVPRLAIGELRATREEEDSATVAVRVYTARMLQLERRQKVNCDLLPREMDEDCALAAEDQLLLETAQKRLGLSPRSYHRILKVARTIADLAGSVHITSNHLAEAIAYRLFDRAL